MSDWNLEKCNRVAHTIASNMKAELKDRAETIDVQTIVKQGVLWMHLHSHVVHLLQCNPIEECIQNMNGLHDHIHTHPLFIREYTSEFLSQEDSDVAIIQYAIALKRYKLAMEDKKHELQAILHSLVMVTPEDVPLLLPSVRTQLKAYLQYKKDVCDSIVNLFEYVVEYEELQKISTHPALQPSSDPLPVAEAPQVLLPLTQELVPNTLAPGLRPTLLPSGLLEEPPWSHVAQSSLASEDDTLPSEAEALA